MNSTPQIVQLKRSQWECYIDCPDSIIETINTYFSYVLVTYRNAFDAQAEIFKYLEFFSEWGFYDSECLQAATDTLNSHFKSNLTRWSQLG